MRIHRGQVSTTIAVLIVVVVLLASSTLYLASVAFLSRRPAPFSTGTVQIQSTSRFPSADFAVVSDQSAGVASSANSITVSGTGEASYVPDEALIQVSVQTNNATAEGATSSNAVDMANVIMALNGIGISNSSIETQGYTLSVNYANCYSSCTPQITGYTVTNSLQVNITSDNPTALGLTAGHVIDTSVKAGANGISLSFGVSNAVLTQLTNVALQSAVASADSQAKAIASSLGVSVSGVISATTSTGGYYPESYSLVAAVAPRGAASSATPIVPGTQTVSATVTVVYSIS